MSIDNLVYSASTIASLGRAYLQCLPNYACDNNCDSGGCDSEGDADSGCDQCDCDSSD
ncbi:MAG: hypothetical protein WC548_04335 [Candidatus Pacearchaeota archaeon]